MSLLYCSFFLSLKLSRNWTSGKPYLWELDSSSVGESFGQYSVNHSLALPLSSVLSLRPKLGNFINSSCLPLEVLQIRMDLSLLPDARSQPSVPKPSAGSKLVGGFFLQDSSSKGKEYVISL